MRWLVAALIGFAVLLAAYPLIRLAVVAGTTLLAGQVAPGVTIAGYPVGGHTPEELILALETEWNRQPRLLVTDGTHNITAAPVDLGVTINAQATAEQAFAVGRGENMLAEWLWLARFGDHRIEPLVHFDAETTRRWLIGLTPSFSVSPVEAALRQENGQWTAVSGQDGYTIDIDATLLALSADPQAVIGSGVIPVTLRSVAPQVRDLSPVLDDLRRAMQLPLHVQAYDPITDETLQWSIPADVVGQWARADVQGSAYTIDLEVTALRAYLQEAQPEALGSERSIDEFTPPDDLSNRWQSGEPITVTVRHNPTSYTVQPGDNLTRIAYEVGMPYWKIQQANPTIDPDRLTAGTVLVIPSKNEMLPLPVVRGKRIVISISQQHMWTYENGALRSEHVISTGIDRSPTFPGLFQIQTHEVEAYASVWDLYMPHFMGIYESWPGFMNGIHGLPTLSSGRTLWAGNLGRPVSYGCIILGLEEAEALFEWAEAGVVVEIQP